MNGEDYSRYPIAVRGVEKNSYRRFNYQLGDPRKALTLDTDYYLSLLRDEKWSAGSIASQINREDYRFEKDPQLCQALTLVVENEVMFTQGLSKFINMMSSYFTETRLALGYILRDDTKHLDCLFIRLDKGRKLKKLSNLLQFSLSSLLSINDFSAFATVAIVLGKLAVRTLCKYLASEIPEDPAAPLLANMMNDEELHAAYAVSHLRYRLEHDMDFRDALRGVVADYELYLVGVSGMDETYFGAFLDLLGERGVRDMVSEVNRLRFKALVDAGLSERYVEELLEPLKLERRGLC